MPLDFLRRRRLRNELRDENPLRHPMKRLALQRKAEPKKVDYETLFGEMRVPLKEDTPVSRFPITQLPSEILAEVFDWYILSVYRATQKQSLRAPRPYSWLVLGHVCRAWRGVLVGYPKLSTYITLTKVECVQEMIDRSGSLPLHVRESPASYLHLSGQLEMNNFVLKHILRLATAHITIRPSSIKTISEVLPHGTSQLRALNISFWHYPDLQVDSEGPIFPNIKFPRLRALSCSLGGLSMVSNMLHPGLRCLEICRPVRMSIDRLLAAIAPLQGLEELHLRDVCIETNPENHLSAESLLTPHQHQITLPCLRNLLISDTWTDQGIFLLHRIVYPASASVRVHLSGFQPHVYEAIRTVAVAKLHGQGVLGVPPEAQSFSLLAGFDIKLHLCLWKDVLPLDAIEQRRYAAEGAFFQLSVSFVASEAAVRTLLEQLPLDRARTAHVSEQVVDAEPLARTQLLAGLPLLEELALEYEAFDNAPDAPNASLAWPEGDTLSPPPSDDADAPRLFPSLRVLRVHELHHSHSLHTVDHVSELRRLARWLGAEATAAVPAADAPPLREGLDAKVRRSDFGTVPLCCSSCAGAHTIGPFAQPMSAADFVPCYCLPCFHLVSGIARVVRFVKGRRRRW